MRLILRFLGFRIRDRRDRFLIVAVIGAGVIYTFSKDLPDTAQLSTYEPPVTTRVHASDGSILAEYARERRLYLPSSAIPTLVKQAFISAEDKNFYTHTGVDPEGIVRALSVLAQGGRHVQGASTITQQVAKNFLVGNERSIERKIREALLSFRIEGAYSKDQILELYLNEIYLGLGNYGVAAAALNYFGKSVHELTIAEAAYLAALPKGPNNYHPFQHRERAIERRNWVIDRMVENGVIAPGRGEKAKAEPLGVNPRVLSPNTFVAGFFAEEVRRELLERYGEKKLYEGGLSVRSTLDPKMQAWHARRSPTASCATTRRMASVARCAISTFPARLGPSARRHSGARRRRPWRLAVVLTTSEGAARIGLQPHREKSGEVERERESGTLAQEGMRWTGRSVRSRASRPGDVIYVEPLAGRPGQYRLRQIPEVSAARSSRWTRTPAASSRWSAASPSINPSSTARPRPCASRAPRSSPSSMRRRSTMAIRPPRSILDAPIEIDQADGSVWRPENFEGKASGPHTLRYGVEHSINQMTVRLARDVGMPLIAEYAKRFGIYDDLPALSRDVARRRRNDAHAHDHRLFDAREWRQANQGDPDRPHPGPLGPYDLPARRARMPGLRRAEMAEPERAQADRQARAGARSADRLSDHLDHGRRDPARHRPVDQGGRQASRRQDRHDQRGQGSLVHRLFARSRVGVFIGYDQPRSLGDHAQAAHYTAPIFRDFMKMALEGQAGRAVPRAAGHQADLGQCAVGHALERSRHDS